jgi:hypothetical protein
LKVRDTNSGMLHGELDGLPGIHAMNQIRT